MSARESIGGGRYALAEEIASGGMATVHLGRQLGAVGFARTVAVKRLHERYARAPEFVAMFLDEARIVARVRHPNVVQTLDVVAEDDELFLVMDFVLGESLVKLLTTLQRRGARVAPSIAVSILAGVLHGLHAAHEALGERGEPLGIVHRDVSPHNVLVGVDGVARVLDFGVAKASERVQSTEDGQVKGKLSYMAPEQIAGGVVDRRTDVYAASVVLWECLVGAKLFSGGNEARVLNQVLTAPVAAPGAAAPGVPPALDAIVMRGLSRDPAARFGTAREMAEALERSGSLATTSEVAAWVRETARESVDQRALLVSALEARTSTTTTGAVDSLRGISSLRADRASGRLPPPPTSAPVVGFKEPSTGAVQLSMAPPPPSNAAAGRGRGILLGLVVTSAFVAVVGGVAGLYASRVAGRTAPPSASQSARAGADPSGARAPAAAASAEPTRCPEGMVFVPRGNFFMGSDDDLPAEKPAHRVSLHAFCMDKREVTTRAYKACSERGDCKRAGTTNLVPGLSPREQRAYDELCNASADDRLDHPINCVDWSMADRFCRASGKRLPTEAEWEFAARGSDGRRYPWGDTPPTARHLNACGSECVAWGRKRGLSLTPMYAESDGHAGTAPVGSFPGGSSPFGVEDVVGNVWEWVADYYGPYAGDDQVAPRGPASGETRVIRGGGWNGAEPSWVRPTFRYHDASTTRSHGIGFRCAADATAGDGGG